MNSFVVLQRNK